MLVCPSPKSHDHDVISPVDRSVKDTVVAPLQTVGLPTKSACGGGIAVGVDVGISVGDGVSSSVGMGVGSGVGIGIGVDVGDRVGVGSSVSVGA